MYMVSIVNYVKKYMFENIEGAIKNGQSTRYTGSINPNNPVAILRSRWSLHHLTIVPIEGAVLFELQRVIRQNTEQNACEIWKSQKRYRLFCFAIIRFSLDLSSLLWHFRSIIQDGRE